MMPVWVLGMLLTGIFLCQTDGSLAASDETIGLVRRSLLDSNDYSELLTSEGNQQEVNGLQKQDEPIPCGQPPGLKHGSWWLHGRVVIYSCNRGFAMVGYSKSVCMPNFRWRFPAPYCVAIYYGPRGNKGPCGPAGPRGIKGDNGMPGPSGWNGQNGAPGMAGTTGAAGLPGSIGWPGSLGPHGLPGSRGDNGRNGAPGRKGNRGSPGQRGALGPAGPQGPMGEKGDPGPQGPSGSNVVVVTSAFSAALDISNPSISTPIIWQRVIYNGDGDFQASSGIFLCRIAGVYRFTFIFQIFSLSAYVVFRVNDVTVWSIFQPFNSYYEVASASLIIMLNQGDKVWLEIKDNCNGVKQASIFYGHLISPYLSK